MAGKASDAAYKPNLGRPTSDIRQYRGVFAQVTSCDKCTNFGINRVEIDFREGEKGKRLDHDYVPDWPMRLRKTAT
jgi:hypothetical protein